VWTPFQSLLAIVSLAILQLPRSILFLVNPESRNQLKTLDDTKKQFCTDHDAVHELNEIFMKSAAAGLVTASPAVVAWAMILHTLWMQAVEDKEDRELQQSQIAMDDFDADFDDSPLKQRPSTRTWSTPPIPSLKPTLFEDLYEVVKAPLEEDAVTFMARCAIDECHVFEAITVMSENLDAISDPRSIDKIPSWIRIMFIDLLRSVLTFLDYTPESVSSLLSLLAPPAKWEDVPWMDNESVMDDPRRYFIEDSELMDKFYRVAQSRFPYETLPYLRLSKALAAANVTSDEELPFVVLSMRHTPSYTEQNPEEFGGYHTIREDENANFVSLTQALAMFPLSQPRALFSPQSQNGAVAKVNYILQPGTVGRVISESKPAVVVWTYEYHGLSYFGRWLEVFFSKQLLEMSGSEEIALEVVGFLAALVESSVKVGKTRRSDDKAFKEAQDILELASDDIDRSGDIISVVLGILEQELQNVANPTSGDRPLDLVLACLHFLRATTKVLPGRVWPFLARSSFLGLEGRGGMLGAILSAVEVPSGNFEFLIASIQVFATLVEDAVVNAVSRKSSIETRSRTSNANLSYSGTPTHVMTKVLHAFGQILVEVYESSANWRFVDDMQRLEINTALTSTFDKILYYAYGVDETHNVSEKATSVLSTFAPYLLDFFLTQSPRDITFNPLLRVLFDGITTPQSSVYLKPRDLWVSQVQATLRLANTLVRAGRLLGYPASSLERQLFQASPVLVRLYASDEGYKHLVVTLLETLIKDAGSREGDPPSLLGNLGTLTARNFGDCLSFFDKPMGDVESEIRIWNLLSALVSNRQQWIAIVLLTGSTPRNKLMKKDSPTDDSMRSKPLLETAVSLTSDIEALEPRLAVAILEFVALAQEHWPWAVGDFNQYPQFLPNLFDYMSRIEYAKDSMISNCYTARIASLIADIIAVFLHHSRLNGGDFATRQKNEIRKALPWLVQNGAHSTGYNSSLHRNLEKNLAKCYPGCKLLDFKRTSLQRLDFGRDFLYDTHVAEKLLSYNRAWRGRGPPNRDQGFEGEFQRANINLSKFEAQSVC
jgi:nuclear pore complex protein Nup188